MNFIKRHKIIRFTSFISFLITLFSSISLFCFGCNLNSRKLNGTEVFINSRNSVVELIAGSEETGKVYGSAICIDKNYLITNAHLVTYQKEEVIETYDSIAIRLYNSDVYLTTSIVKYDLEKDLCILELKNLCDDLKPVQIHSDINIESGERVFAIGNAMNHGIGLTEGTISLPLVNIIVGNNEMSVIQCDITIASGSSGGGLFNEYGQLIGITTFRIKDQNGYIIYGIGFALPIDSVNAFLSMTK